MPMHLYGHQTNKIPPSKSGGLGHGDFALTPHLGLATQTTVVSRFRLVRSVKSDS
jgi:hypothetical protein